MITEKQAWLEMAEAYSTDFKERTEWQHQLTWAGCCHTTNILHMEDYISWATYMSMDKKIIGCLTRGQRYFCPSRLFKRGFTDEYDALRADFCYLMHYSCGDGNNERI